ncbi:tol-pal system YbgF family protein [candidate division CSSED10-310 bacterium]|uniref:Tol-pal system YbgF family protein n=1 Tax=candidate division CSSED10-310 bacterium TaxID=2855610 RepID=A0ABV6YT24_UNCC1
MTQTSVKHLRWSIILSACLATFLTFACNRPEEGKTLFHQGRVLVTVGQYQEAIPKLEHYLEKHPQGKYASRACLFLGKAYLGLLQFSESRTAFERAIRDFPNTLEAHKSRYKLAILALLEGREQEAMHLFSELAEKPDGPLAPEARAMGAMLQHQIRDK